MKKVKAQIKSETRVKSMLDFSNDEENVNSGVIAKNDNIPAKNGAKVAPKGGIPAQNDGNDGVIINGKSDKNNAKSVGKRSAGESIENSDVEGNNGVVVLNRKRGDVVVSGQVEDEADEPISAEAKAPKSRHFVEVESKTYGGADDGADEQSGRDKKSFKDYMKSAGTTIAQGWDTFINKKGAVRFLAIIVVCVMLTIALIIYSSAQRTNFKDIVNGTCYEVTGAGSYNKIKIDALTANTPSEKMCKNYSTLELVGKNKKKSVNIEAITFGLYTDTANVTIAIELAFYVGEERIWALDAQKTMAVKQRIGNGVRFDIGQSFDFHGATRICMTFTCYDTTAYGKFGTDAERINPQFTLYKLAYTA